MKTYEYKNYGKTYTICLTKEQYTHNGNMAIQAFCMGEYGWWEPFAFISVNLDEPLPDGFAYVDTNNLPNVEEWIKENNLGTPVGEYGFSGFCSYPLYQFKDDIYTEEV